MANRYPRELSSNGFSLRTTFFGEGKHGQAPAEHFLSCVSFQHVHSVLPESVKAYSFNLNDSSFVGQFLSSFFAFFITPSLRPYSLFPFLLESVMRTMMLNLSLFSSFQKSGFYVFKASRSSRKSNVFLGQRVYICRSCDREARKLSEAIGRERQCCVRLRSDCSSAAAFWFSE